MEKFTRTYDATFTIPYAEYMASLQQGFIQHGARLKPGKVFVFTKLVKANTRKAALQATLNWYWSTMKSNWGQASDVIVVSDPYLEVFFWDDFDCSLKENNYLDDQTIARVIEGSNGIIVRNDKTSGQKHHPTNTLKRTKRRRVYLERVAKNLYRHPTSGTMYYRRTVVPQLSTDGKRGKPGTFIKKRKVTNVKLVATEVRRAVNEVWRRFQEDIKI